METSMRHDQDRISLATVGQPVSWATGCAADQVRFVVRSCSLGQVLVAGSLRGVCAIFLGTTADTLAGELKAYFPHAQVAQEQDDVNNAADEVVRYIERPDFALDLPLDIRGTDFQRRVWKALCDIPSGSTASYTDIAAQIGAPSAVRAVAGACASNLISVAIPCHRVVRRDGGLSGYRWGVHNKRELLAREADPADHDSGRDPRQFQHQR